MQVLMLEYNILEINILIIIFYCFRLVFNPVEMFMIYKNVYFVIILILINGISII